MKKAQCGSCTITKRACIVGLGLLIVLGLTGMLCTTVQGAGASYSFTKIATLGDPAPGGILINDFEPGALNNWGDAIFGADLGTSADPATFFGEGVFLLNKGQVSELARGGASAPGGGTFEFLFLGPTSLNDPGDAALGFTLTPFGLPVGLNSGLYRYSHKTRTVRAVVIPGVTPAPAGGVFAGVFFGTCLNNRGELLFPGIVATDKGIHLTDEPYIGLGMGVFKADSQDQMTSIVSPGDPAPGGGSFDFALTGWINNAGDVAFAAHVAGEEVRGEGAPPHSFIINALSSLYVKNTRSGEIRSIAHAGAPAPGGGAYRGALAPCNQ